MTAPRAVIPGRILMINRSCTQQQFILRPDDETNNAFTYCLADAAQRYNVDVILSQMESNHHHTMVYDSEGHEVEFREHFHKMMAKSQNALRGRWENLWSSEQPCVVEVMTMDDLLDKLVYIATNPVKDNLVEKVHHWPGPNFVGALLNGRPMKAWRPRHFFRKDGPMPPDIELVMKLPERLPNKEAFLAELRRRIAEVEETCARNRRQTGGSILGRSRVLRQSWRESPVNQKPRRGLRPKVAARGTWLRIMRLQRNKEWEAVYRAAREQWLAGISTAFPYGTYWLRRFALIVVKPPPFELTFN